MVENNPQIKRREAWVDLPEAYAGFRAKIWVNSPKKYWDALTQMGSDDATAIEAAKKLVLEHNGWLDFDGNPYPPPSEDAFWEEIPTELMVITMMAASQEMVKLPNSMRPTRRRSKRG